MIVIVIALILATAYAFAFKDDFPIELVWRTYIVFAGIVIIKNIPSVISLIISIFGEVL